MSDSNASVLERNEVVGELAPGETLFEVVEGREVAKPIMGAFEHLITAIITFELGSHVVRLDLGRVVPEPLVRLDPDRRQMRRPDVAFVSYQRWGRDRRVTSAQGWEVVPDLVVEVVSPTDFAADVLAKAREYLSAGVIQVWVVYPNVREVHIFGPSLNISTFRQDDVVECADLLPGFQLSLAELFRDGEEPQVV